MQALTARRAGTLVRRLRLARQLQGRVAAARVRATRTAAAAPTRVEGPCSLPHGATPTEACRVGKCAAATVAGPACGGAAGLGRPYATLTAAVGW